MQHVTEEMQEIITGMKDWALDKDLDKYFDTFTINDPEGKYFSLGESG